MPISRSFVSDVRIIKAAPNFSSFLRRVVCISLKALQPASSFKSLIAKLGDTCETRIHKFAPQREKWKKRLVAPALVLRNLMSSIEATRQKEENIHFASPNLWLRLKLINRIRSAERNVCDTKFHAASEENDDINSKIPCCGRSDEKPKAIYLGYTGEGGSVLRLLASHRLQKPR